MLGSVPCTQQVQREGRCSHLRTFLAARVQPVTHTCLWETGHLTSALRSPELTHIGQAWRVRKWISPAFGKGQEGRQCPLQSSPGVPKQLPQLPTFYSGSCRQGAPFIPRGNSPWCTLAGDWAGRSVTLLLGSRFWQREGVTLPTSGFPRAHSQ